MKEFFNNLFHHSDVPVTRTTVLDPAHIGDIHGALGTLKIDDHPHSKTMWKKFLAFLVILGPGLIVMVGDNDAGGVATYAQAGQNYGTSLLWTLLLLVPVLIVNQEMVVRLGTITRVGHARLIIKRFGKFWGFFSAGDLFILNFLTIITEFIGISLAMSYFGVSQYISVPVAAAVLIGITLTGSFKHWEQSLFGFIAVSFIMFPLALMVHPSWGPVFKDTFLPRIQGGLSSDALLLIIGIVGTTVAPWQLFFQQSNVIDKRITPRWLSYEKLDTYLGAIITNTGAAALIIAGAALVGTKFAGNFTDALGVAHGLTQVIGSRAGDIFAIVLFDASVIGAAAVTLSTAYAVGDVFKTSHSLHHKFSEAKGFYLVYSLLVAFAAGIVLIPHAPLGLITLGVQALAGILLPSATVFLLFLCNDKEVLGPWTNGPVINAITSVIVGVLVMLSLILAATTLFPSINVTYLTLGLGIMLILGLLGTGILYMKTRTKNEEKTISQDEKTEWRMPPLDELKPSVWSVPMKIGMYVLRGYLFIAVGLMVIKVIQLATGH